MHQILTSSENPVWQNFENLAQHDLRFLLDWKNLSPSEISAAFVTPERIRSLNKTYMNKDSPTDVLSFEQNEWFGDYYCLGDIVVCVDIARQQAEEKKVSVIDEVRLLMTHGFLHLLGYDHAEAEEEKVMFALQQELVQKLASAISTDAYDTWS